MGHPPGARTYPERTLKFRMQVGSMREAGLAGNLGNRLESRGESLTNRLEPKAHDRRVERTAKVPTKGHFERTPRHPADRGNLITGQASHQICLDVSKSAAHRGMTGGYRFRAGAHSHTARGDQTHRRGSGLPIHQPLEKGRPLVTDPLEVKPHTGEWNRLGIHHNLVVIHAENPHVVWHPKSRVDAGILHESGVIVIKGEDGKGPRQRP